MTAPLLAIRDLATWFETEDGLVKAVDGVSLDVARGEVLGLVGESGSGKSVLSLSIMRLVATPPGRYAAGRVLFEGRDVLAMAEDDVRRLRGNRISMVFQDPMTSLNPFLTVGRQLTEVLEVHERLGRKQATLRSVEMLERVGIPDPARRIRDYPHQFSGGMRQRVMIAMALLCKPALLIADEPTTALDVTIQAQILELIRDLVRDLGTSVLLITHDLGVVAGMADRVAVMYAGRVVEESATAALFAEPRHPYTRGLLRCVPRAGEPLVPIPGSPPDLSSLPPGCPFAPRCELVEARCLAAYPPLVALTAGADRKAACFAATAGSGDPPA